MLFRSNVAGRVEVDDRPREFLELIAPCRKFPKPRQLADVRGQGGELALHDDECLEVPALLDDGC